MSTISTIQVRTEHAESDLAIADITESHANGHEVDQSTAVTIASWWQSSGNVGSQLAAFASGAVVTREALLDDIHATRVHEGYHNGRMSDDDKLALDMLATFVLRYA